MEAGERFASRYDLKAKLGESDFGQTWRAQDVASDASVVVKVLAGKRHAAFERETSALRALARDRGGTSGSPSVRPICDVGSSDDGHRYIVYPWIEGETLDVVLARSGTFSRSRALEIARALAGGLAALHTRGILHRDVKPSNIVLPADGSLHGAAVLLDLGLAGAVRPESGTTKAGEVFGSPFYMAPEQVMGREQSPAVDVYGLGAVVYEMLFGRVPFVADSVPELLLKIMGHPVSLDGAPELDEGARDFLRACLEKDPSLRPRDGAAALERIDRLLSAPGAAPLTLAGAAAPTPPVPAAAPMALKGAKGAAPLLGSSSEPRRASTRAAWALFAAASCICAGGFFLAARAQAVPAAIAGAVFCLVGGAVGSAGAHAFVRAKRRMSEETSDLRGRALSREDLSKSIELELDALIALCKGGSDRILGASVALMIREYSEAKSFDDRQKALVGATQLLEKLSVRLSPWYVRNEKLLPTVVGVVGVLSAVVTMVAGVLGKK